MSKEQMPISQVEWVKATELKANDYNPNHVAPIELKLLKVSLMEDGWTQPVVIRENNEIVDGFHRWTLCSKDKQISEMTDGMVPVVRLKEKDISEKLTLNDFIIKASAEALIQVPEVNVAFAGDHVMRFHNADISVAVALPGGQWPLSGKPLSYRSRRREI